MNMYILSQDLKFYKRSCWLQILAFVLSFLRIPRCSKDFQLPLALTLHPNLTQQMFHQPRKILKYILLFNRHTSTGFGLLGARGTVNTDIEFALLSGNSEAV